MFSNNFKRIKLKLADKLSLSYIVLFLVFMIFCEFFVIYFLKVQHYENSKVSFSRKIEEINVFFDKLELFSNKCNNITLDFNPKIQNHTVNYSKPFDNSEVGYKYIVRVRNAQGYDFIPLNTFSGEFIDKNDLIKEINSFNKSIKITNVNKNMPVDISDSKNATYSVIRMSRDIRGNLFDIYIFSEKTNEIFTYRALILILTLYTLIGLVIILIISNRISKNILKPINSIIQTANSVSTDDLSIRITPTNTNDELDNLIGIINRMLERLNIAFDNQSKFISDVSHELRTPLSIIRGYAELTLRHGEKDKNLARESLEFIVNETNNMKNLIDKLLFLARGDANTVKIKMENFYSTEFINQLSSDSLFFVREHNIIIEKNEKYTLYADKSLLLQAIRALLENSVKYSQINTNIYITSYFDKENKNAVISIRDEGIGIDEKHFDKIFERFYRIDESRTKQTGGTGLGLSIVKKIITLHNGSINIKSQIGKGTTFIMTIPLIVSKKS